MLLITKQQVEAFEEACSPEFDDYMVAHLKDSITLGIARRKRDSATDQRGHRAGEEIWLHVAGTRQILYRNHDPTGGRFRHRSSVPVGR